MLIVEDSQAKAISYLLCGDFRCEKAISDDLFWRSQRFHGSAGYSGLTNGCFEALQLAGMSLWVVEVRASRLVFPRLGLWEVILVLSMVLGAHCLPKKESGLSSGSQPTIGFARISPKDMGVQLEAIVHV